MLRLVIIAACAATARAACTADDIKVKKPDQGDKIYVRDGLEDDPGPVTIKWEITNDDCDFATVQLQLCPSMGDDDDCGDFILDPEDQTGGVNYFFTCNDEKSEDGEPWECVGKAEIVIEDLLDCGSPPCTGLHKFKVCSMESEPVCADSDVFTLQLPGGTWFPSMSPTLSPTVSPYPTPVPSISPRPSPEPSLVPTAVPSSMPSLQPSSHPTPVPSSLPTSAPTPDPTSLPSLMPTPRPALVRQRARRLSRQGTCQGTGCHYDFGYQWSTTECEPGDANYPEGCEAGGGGGATSRPTLVPTPQPSVSPVPTTVSPYSEYIFVEEAVPWNEAVVYCETHYDHLATICMPRRDPGARYRVRAVRAPGLRRMRPHSLRDFLERIGTEGR